MPSPLNWIAAENASETLIGDETANFAIEHDGPAEQHHGADPDDVSEHRDAVDGGARGPRGSQ